MVPTRTRQEIRSQTTLLSEWKHDKTALLARFDADRDGEISLGRMGACTPGRVRRSRSRPSRHPPESGIHLMRKPPMAAHFLIANREVTALVRHYRLWSWLHLSLMLAALLG